MSSRAENDEGFTLMELLISISISVVVLAGLVGIFIAMLAGNQTVSARELDASAGQQLAVVLPADLQSTFPNHIDRNSSTPSGCADSAGTNVVQMQWQQATWDANNVEGAPIKFIASYRIVGYTTDKGVAASQLFRYFCSGTDPSTVSADVRPIASGLTAPGSSPAPAAASVAGPADPHPGTITVTTSSLNGTVYQYVITPRTAPVGGTPGNPPPTQPATATPPPVPPSVKSLVMKDVDHDGYVDEVDVGLTAAPTDMSQCTSNSAWSLSNVPSNGAEGAITGSGSAIVIAVTPPTDRTKNAPDTSVGNFTVSFSPTGTSCNILGLSNAPPSDGAKPVVVGVQSINPRSNTAGKMESGDQLAVTFSEPLASAPSSPGSATESTDGTLGAPTTLTITGVTNGGVSTGGTYVNGSQPYAPTFQANYGLSGSTLTVTLTGKCAPNSDCGHLTTGFGALVFVPSSALTDAAGNGAAGSFTTPILFRLF